jgi:hypothetical protein
MAEQSQISKCSERGCPFPVAPGSNLCAHHICLFADDEYIEFHLEVFHSKRKQHRRVTRAREIDVDGAERLRIVSRGSYERDVWAATGKCNRCGAERESGRKYCLRCLANDRFRKLVRITKGLCRTCQHPAAPSRKRCNCCLEKELHRTLARIRLKLEDDLCPQCGLVNDRKGKWICSACEERTKAYRSKRAASSGAFHLCRQCRAQIEPGSSFRICGRCRNRNNDRQRVTRSLRVDRGTCKRCGKSPTAAGRVLCESCRAKVLTVATNRRKRFESLNVCTRCGRPRDGRGKWCSRCAAACRDYHSKVRRHVRNRRVSETFRQKCRALDKRRYELQKSSGACVNCGRPSRIGRVLCLSCAGRDQRKYRAKKAAQCTRGFLSAAKAQRVSAA